MHEPLLPCPPHVFDEPAARVDARRALPVTPRHVALEVALDPAVVLVEGRVTHVFEVRARAVTTVRLDAGDPERMSVRSVTRDGQAVPFAHAGEALDVQFEPALVPGERVELVVAYSAQPTTGLHFVPLDPEVPTQRLQVWTQGAMEDHHHWFPCFDAPEHLVTTTVTVTVPEGYVALSNGRPEGTASGEPVDEGRRRFRWSMERPHALYLLNLVVDRLVEVTDEADGVSLHHWVPAGREADARVLFARMPEMLRFFAHATGTPYPFGRYGHVFLQEFMWGGMENTTLTSLTDLALIEGRHLDEEDLERLFAHELAHQWFGDLIAPRGWPELWLNESFATYFEILCMQALEGDDDFERRLLAERDHYFGEARDRYARPIVTRKYAHPYVLFDRHAYEKGCLVLHTLRDQLGETAFWTGVRSYVTSCAGRAAETAELRRAFEEASGEDLTAFFEQMVYGAGHAKVRPKWRFDPRYGLEVELTRLDDGAQSLVATLGVGTSTGESLRFRVPVTPGHRVIVLPLDKAPRWVALDPDFACLIELDEQDEPDDALRARLVDTAPRLLRGRTARVLAGRATPQNQQALARALVSDTSATTRIELARALGEHRSETAREALFAALDTEQDWRVRVALSRAVGVGADPSVVPRIATRLAVETSHRARCGLLQALGLIQVPASRAVIESQLEVDAPRACIATAAVSALAAQEEPETIDTLLDRTARTRPRLVRTAAIAGLSRVARAEGTKPAPRRRVRERLEALLRDPTFAVRAAAIDALKELNDSAALPALRRAHGAETFGLLRRFLREALGALEASRKAT
jgi:aminopeptidase N